MKSRVLETTTKEDNTVHAGDLEKGTLVRFSSCGRQHYGLITGNMSINKTVDLISLTNGASWSDLNKGIGPHVTPLRAGETITLEAL